MKNWDRIFLGLIIFLLGLQIVRDDFSLDEWSIVLVLILFAMILLTVHPEVSKFRISGSGVEVVRETRELSKKLEGTEVGEDVRKQVEEAKTTSDDQTLVFIKLWIDIEKEINRIGERNQLDVSRPPIQTLKALERRGFFDKVLSLSLENLRTVRNRVIHGRLDLTDEEASQLVTLAEYVLARLKSIN